MAKLNPFVFEGTKTISSWKIKGLAGFCSLKCLQFKNSVLREFKQIDQTVFNLAYTNILHFKGLQNDFGI